MSRKVKVALVTGASGGLGSVVALALGRAGYRVALNYLQNGSRAGEVAAALGGDALPLRADVGITADVAGMAREVEDRWGRLDVLVNNAGITRDAPLLRLNEADWDNALKVNLRGCLNTARAFAPLLEASGGGHIINISSRSGLSGRPGQAAYSASKAALLGLTLSLAAELGPANIRVNALLPGYMPAGMGGRNGKAMERAREESMLGRLSAPSEAASFVLWLSGTENITGQIFTLDSRGAVGLWATGLSSAPPGGPEG